MEQNVKLQIIIIEIYMHLFVSEYSIKGLNKKI